MIHLLRILFMCLPLLGNELRATNPVDSEEGSPLRVLTPHVSAPNKRDAPPGWNRVFNTRIGNILRTPKTIEINGIPYGPECVIECHPNPAYTPRKPSKDPVRAPFKVTLSVYASPAEFEFILKEKGLL